MVELKVCRIGDALGVVLPAAVVARLKADDGSALYLAEAPDGGYRLTAADPDLAAKMAKAEDIMRRYPDTLDVLAR